MTQPAAASEDHVPTKPRPLKTIAAVFFVLPLMMLPVYLFTLTFYPLYVSPFYGRLTFARELLALAIANAELTGAVLLWRLRRSAFNCFVGALMLVIVKVWWDVLARGSARRASVARRPPLTPSVTNLDSYIARTNG